MAACCVLVSRRACARKQGIRKLAKRCPLGCVNQGNIGLVNDQGCSLLVGCVQSSSKATARRQWSSRLWAIQVAAVVSHCLWPATWIGRLGLSWCKAKGFRSSGGLAG